MTAKLYAETCRSNEKLMFYVSEVRLVVLKNERFKWSAQNESFKCVHWFYLSSSSVTGCQPFRFVPPRGSLAPRRLIYSAIAIWIVKNWNDPPAALRALRMVSPVSALVATCLPQHLHSVLRLTRTLPIAVLRPGLALHININNTDWTDKRDMFCVDLRTNSDYFPIQR
jgi:hypothetical protein